MKSSFFILASLFALSTMASVQNLVVTETDLDSDTGVYLDAHNHNGGVIPPLGLVNLEKFIYGGSLELDELKNFWSSYINSNVIQEKALINSLFSAGTKMFISCNNPLKYCSQLIDNDKCREKLEDGLMHLFASTPLTSFGTAYGLRRYLVDVPNLKSNATLRRHALLFELAKTRVGIVEMSRPSMGGYADNDSKRDFVNYAELTQDLRKETPSSKANQKFKARLKELNLEIPSIKWLLMIHTSEMGSVDSDSYASFANGQCSVLPLADALKTDLNNGFYNVLLNSDDVVGVDVAGPETTCFSKDGMKKFKELAEVTYQAAVAKQHKRNHKGKLVVRAHVGEGAPISNQQYFSNEQTACNAIQNFQHIKQVFDADRLIPVHHVEAQKNIAQVLAAIAELQKIHPDINDYVVFRLAHLTHITEPLAKRAKQLGVTADVNLSSNVATGSLTIDPAIIDRVLVKKGISPIDSPDILQKLIENGASLGEIFNNHGLKWLLFHNVPTLLGSDGSGVEHTKSLKGEYEMARELIKFWRERDKNFAAKNVTIDELLKNQALHYEAMGY